LSSLSLNPNVVRLMPNLNCQSGNGTLVLSVPDGFPPELVFLLY
jgi:pyrroline-5-carboxylate reductase